MSRFIPGFRFHPTDVELVMYYLKRKLLGKRLIFDALAEVKIYDFSPWDLPDKSKLRNGDLEWFFFCPKERKYSCGSRTNRATESGFWKATGKDRPVEYKLKTVAMIKTLVFHLGHAPKGERTDWVMHEFRMEDKDLADKGVVQDLYVICRLFKKSGAGPKNGAQYGAPFNEDEWDNDSGPSESAALGLPLGLPLVAADPSVSVSDPGLSTITTGSTITAPPDEPVNNNDTVFTDLEIAALLGDTDNHENVQNVEREEESEIFDQLEDLIKFEDRNDFNMSSANCTVDMFISSDDLETDLGFFY